MGSAARTTETEVEVIINVDSSTDVEPFIETAHIIVEDMAASSYDDEKLTMLERWLAAHLVATKDQIPESVKLGDASAKYFGRSGMGLDGTRYGQQVKLLDTEGVLSKTGKSKVKFKAL